MNLSEELVNAITPHEIFSIPLFGLNIPVTDTVITMWLVMVFLIIFAVVITRRMQLVPKGKQNVAEAIVELINNFAKGNIGHHWRPFAPYLGTVLLFLMFSNIISIFNIIPNGEILYEITHVESLKHFGIRPPTRDANVTVCLAAMSVILVLFSGIGIKGFKGWLRYHIEPTPVILPFKILDYPVRTLSLSMRLFGNILGAFIIMELIYAVFPMVVPAAFSIYFDLFDGLLQAYVFVFLTSLYIAEAIE